MQRITLATGLAAVLLFSPSCSESAAAGPSGTYKMDVNATVAGMPKEMTSMMDASEIEKMMDATMDLKADGTFSSVGKFPGMDLGTMKLAAQEFTNRGTWSLKDGTISLNQTHVDDKEKPETATATLKDGVLTMKTSEEGKQTTLVFNKQ